MADDRGDPIWVDHGDGIEVPEVAADGTGESRWWMGLLAVVVVGVVAASWASAGSNPPETAATSTSAPPTTVAAPPTTTEAPRTTTTTDPNRHRLSSQISSPVVFEDGWLAMRIGTGRPALVRSVDGLAWTDLDSDLPAGRPLSLMKVDQELVLAIEIPNLTDDNVRLAFWSSSDAVLWELDSDSRARSSMVRDDAIVVDDGLYVVVDRAPLPIVPFPELGEVVAELIGPALADDVCRVEDLTESSQAFTFFDCNGEIVVEFAEEERSRLRLTEEDWSCLDFLGFATSRPQAVLVLDPSGEGRQLALDPFLVPTSLSPTADGFVASVIDIRNFAPRIGPCSQLERNGESGVFVWTAATGLTRAGPPLEPQRSVFGFGLAALEDGRLLLTRSDGAYVAESPYEEWTLLIEPPGSGGMMAVSDDGRVLTYTEFNSATVRVSVAPVGGEWIELVAEGQAGYEPFLGTDDYAIVARFGIRGFELLRIDY